MCGICLSVAFLNSNNERPYDHYKNYKLLTQNLAKRGPNFFNEISEVLDGRFDLFFCSSVLHLRGSKITVQPVVDDKKNAFLWNGEIFDGSLIKTNSGSSVSDTVVIAETMFKAQTVYEVLQIISAVKGPYAFIFNQANGQIWFGRDIFGRRSLLWSFKDSVFQLSSIASNTPDNQWEEVPTAGIFCLDLNLSFMKQAFVIHLYAWSSSASGGALSKKVELLVPSTIAEISLASDICIQVPISESLNREVPSDFSTLNLLSLLSGLHSELTKEEIFQKIIDLPIFKETLNNFETVLSYAVKLRVEEQLNWCKECYFKNCHINSTSCCDHSSVGVLFSGGLDSIVIACLADRYVNSQCSIDLINVAFACKKNAEVTTAICNFDTPDRVTGKNGYEALKDVSPNRKWKFVEVNVTDSELRYKREQCISGLLYPSCTVLDDSIGCALWFASQGEGFIFVDGEQIAYKSPARVLLVGMGADEQLAGYSRHRAKFKNASWDGLIEEIALELDRIGSRNLGRDDRIIADSGVESRYPFLDENVVSFLNALPIWLKANLNFDRGIGEKLLLRLLAFKLGLTEAAALPKRAIQFGSRIAKLENHKEKGSDKCTRLLKSTK